MASHLKAAGKAILNSPKALRRKFAGGNDSEGHHDKLDEDWYHSDDPIKSGISFYVKYLGATEVTKTHGPGSTDDAVKKIVHHAKQRGGKLQKVQITISSRLLKIQDVTNQIKLEEIPLYRVSYCTVDPYYDKVFCYISRNHENKKLECHAFLCSKKSKAEAITLTVAQAFNIAFERWQSHKKKKAARQQQQQQQQQQKLQGGGPGQKDTTTTTKVANGGTPSAAAEDSTQPVADLLGEPLTVAPSKPPPPQAQQPLHPSPVHPSPLLSSQLSPQHKQQQQGASSVSPPPLAPPPSSGAAAAASSSSSYQQPHVPPPMVIEPVNFSPSPSAVAQTNQAMGSLSLATNTPQNISTNPFASRDDSQVHQKSGLLEVKTTMTKAISLDYLNVDDEFDQEFTRLAEARSNPHLLDIGDHMTRTTSKDEVNALMKGGEGRSGVQDLTKTKSIDDLLML